MRTFPKNSRLLHSVLGVIYYSILILLVVNTKNLSAIDIEDTEPLTGASFISPSTSASTSLKIATRSLSTKDEPVVLKKLKKSATEDEECPKFEDGHCQCSRADASGSSVVFDNPLYRGSIIPGILTETINTSSPLGTSASSPTGIIRVSDRKSTNTSDPASNQFNLVCSFTKSDVIRAALKKVSNLNISTLTLVHNVIPVLDDNFFADLSHLDKLYLKYNRITNISENAFKGVLQDSLKSLLIDEFYWYSFHFKAFDTLPSKALKNLKNLKEFTVSSGYLTNITKDMLNGLNKLESLTLKGYKLANIQQDAFTDLSSLKSLEIKSSNLASVPVKPLSKLRSLRNLKIESRKIQTLNDTSFLKLGDLQKLDLSSCSLNSISDDAFDGLEKSLKYLFLDRNSLKTIPRALNSLKSLEVLDLGNNDVQSIGPNAFLALTSLKNLTLDMNGLITIPEESLRGLEYSLEHLSLMQNRLTQFPSKALNQMRKLKELSLMSNMIMEVPGDALSNHPDDSNQSKPGSADNNKVFKITRDTKDRLADENTGNKVPAPSLVSIDLSRNRLSKVSGKAFSGSWDTLQNLNLAVNKLTEYPVEFGQFNNLTSLDLSINGIETLQVEALEGSEEQLQYLGINGNPWRCDCKMAAFRAWLEEWLKGLTLRDMYKMEKMIRETKCESPEDLKGIPLHYPHISHLVCKDSSNAIVKGSKKIEDTKTIKPLNDSVPSYYFMDTKSMEKGLWMDDFINSAKYNSFKKNVNDKWYQNKSFKLLKILESTRNLAVMAFAMSLIMCLGLLTFTFMSCFCSRSRPGFRFKGLFSPSKSNNSLNSNIVGFGGFNNPEPTMLMTPNNFDLLSKVTPSSPPSNKNSPFTAKTSSSSSPNKSSTLGSGVGPLRFMQPSSLSSIKKWGRGGSKNTNEYDIDNEAFEDDKRAITKHEYDMPSDNPYGPTTTR